MTDCPINKRIRQKARVFSTVDGDLYDGEDPVEAKKMFDDLKKKNDERKKDANSANSEESVILFVEGNLKEVFRL